MRRLREPRSGPRWCEERPERRANRGVDWLQSLNGPGCR